MKEASILLDSGSSISIISEGLLSKQQLNPGGSKRTIVKGIGGSQVAGNAIECKILFKSGWGYSHPLKPMKLCESPDLIILGQDFMSLFDSTLFDWVKGKVKVGSEWVWFTATDSNIPCKFDFENSSNDLINSLKSIVNEYTDIFATNPKAPKQCFGVEHEIILTEDRVCVDKVNRIAKSSTDNVNSQVLEMLEAGIIRNSASAYNSNPLLVKKKDGALRFVIDFRSLNKVTKRDNYPLPNIDDIIEGCRSSKYFSQLDLASGYWCVPIAEKDKHKTAFNVPRGKFEFNRMPFGLVNAQATFQRKIDVVVKSLKQNGHKGVDGYVDNILIHSKTIEEHRELLAAVFEELRECNFTLRADKCEIGFLELDFLGYCLSENTIKPSKENVEKLVD